MRSDINMNWLIVLRLLVCVWAFAAIVKASTSDPPTGNKLFVTLKGRGVQVYQCQQNCSQYILHHATADLYDVLDSHKKGEHYFLTNEDGQGGKLTWSCFEGQNKTTSTVTGKLMRKTERAGTVPDLLLQATSHSGPGDFDKISYISQLQSEGGIPPTMCNTLGEFIQVNYEAFYSFYVREMNGPVDLPSLLSIPDGNVPVASYFGEGVQIYAFNGSAWFLQNVSALLSSVPGQEVVAKHYFLGEPDSNGGRPTWETFMPSTRVTAKIQNRVAVDSDSVPWLSLQATSHTGGVQYFMASISYIQRVSTTGGNPPPDIIGAKIGDIYMSPYTAIYWLYAPNNISSSS